MNQRKNVSAVILAAGNSERMNFPKAFLKWDAKTTFLEKILKELIDFKVNKIVVVLNEKSYKHLNNNSLSESENVKFIINSFPELGRFYSIKLALEKIKTEFCFIQNVDNPFINRNILEKLFINKIDDGYTIPSFQSKGGHPIIINNQIKQDLLFSTNQFILKEFLRNYKCQKIDFEDSRTLVNINTPQDFARLEELKSTFI